MKIIVIFIVVQLLSHFQLFAIPCTAYVNHNSLSWIFFIRFLCYIATVLRHFPMLMSPPSLECSMEQWKEHSISWFLKVDDAS